jgi:hypothetical protein
VSDRVELGWRGSFVTEAGKELIFDYMRLPILAYASHFAVISAIPPRLTEARVPGGFG